MPKNVLYTGFTQYTPEKTDDNTEALSIGVMFLKDDKGNDWYTLSESLNAKTKGATFVLLNPEGVVISVASDPTLFFPAGLSVLVAYDAPEKLADQIREWRYVDGAWDEYFVEAIERAELFLETELTWATAQIGALTDLAAVKELTDAQQKRLDTVKEYRLELIQVDPELAPNIVLPVRPTFKSGK